MQTPSIRLIPAEYLDRVKGNVSTRQALALEANLPKVVLDRLVCDRSKSVRECAAKNPGLDAEQVQTLIEDNDYSVTYELNRNRRLSHEMIAIQLRDRRGVKDDNIFQNPNIKAAEFVGLVKEYLSLTGASNWSRRNVYRSASRNLGVGNGSIIALTEMVYKEDQSQYEELMESALRNESLSSRSIEYMLDRAKRRVDASKHLTFTKIAIQHPNVSWAMVDSVVTDGLAQGLNVMRALTFSENYTASERVVEKLDEVYLNSVNEDYLLFLVNNVHPDLLTPARVSAIELSQNTETLTKLILKVPNLSEESIDRAAMYVAMSGDADEINQLADALYIKSHHIDEMAKSNSWGIRNRAAAMHNVSDETLKKLAIDSDSDVRRTVRENPKWEIIKDAVEEQETAYRFSEKVKMLSRHAEDISTSLLEKYGEDYQDLKSILDAIAVLADPKTRELMNSFKVEESRNLMKDGIDADTLSLLKDFF